MDNASESIKELELQMRVKADEEIESLVEEFEEEEVRSLLLLPINDLIYCGLFCNGK